MSIPSPCPRCATVLAADAPAGLCPKCLFVGALVAAPEAPEPKAGTRVGEYVLLERIARGGMGVVFKARRPGIDRIVALKRILGGQLGDEHEHQRFREEANRAAMLDHPNIVPIYEIGEHEGAPFFTMRLMEGGNLSEHVPRLRTDQMRVAELLMILARAVHHGHQRGVLHRDLKPENVLLDSAGNPHVADFGTSKVLGDASSLTRSGTIVGTAAYMSPEQARGETRGVTTATDIYGLGAILYELLTSRPPFTGGSTEEIRQLVINTEPIAPRSLDPQIEADLETICLKCLEKQPERRYGSAFGLAADLERFLKDENIQARPIGRLERLWRWSRRNPIAAGLALTLAIAIPTVVLVAQRQQQQLVAEVLAANTYAARMAAGTVLFQLREYADWVVRTGNDPKLVDLLERGDSAALRSFAPEAGTRMADGTAVDSWSVLDPRGAPLARWPAAPDESYWERNYAFRDYFKAINSRAVHVSSAFKSEADLQLKFSLSTAIFGADGHPLAVIGAHFATDSAIGPLNLGTAALVVPCDTERDGTRIADYVFLIHPGIAHGKIFPFDASAVAELGQLRLSQQAADRLRLPDEDRVAAASDYRDPVPGFEGRWLAGFAPVGDTGLLVVVQTRHDGAAPLQRLGVLFGLPIGLAALMAALMRWNGKRRPR